MCFNGESGASLSDSDGGLRNGANGTSLSSSDKVSRSDDTSGMSISEPSSAGNGGVKLMNRPEDGAGL